MVRWWPRPVLVLPLRAVVAAARDWRAQPWLRWPADSRERSKNGRCRRIADRPGTKWRLPARMPEDPAGCCAPHGWARHRAGGGAAPKPAAGWSHPGMSRMWLRSPPAVEVVAEARQLRVPARVRARPAGSPPRTPVSRFSATRVSAKSLEARRLAGLRRRRFRRALPAIRRWACSGSRPAARESIRESRCRRRPARR